METVQQVDAATGYLADLYVELEERATTQGFGETPISLRKGAVHLRPACMAQWQPMGKKARIKRERLRNLAATSSPMWRDAEGIHAMLPFPAVPPPGTAELLTANFQRQIRGSPMWSQLVDRFGEKKAEELLKECKAEIR